MSSGSFRWGKTSRCVSCACLVLALREAGVHHALHDVAVRADLKPWSLAQTLFRVQDTLNITKDRDKLAEPSTVLPLLHKAMLEAAEGQQLPAKALEELRRSAPDDDTFLLATKLARMQSLPTCELPGITACTVYIIALEGSRRAKILNYVPLLNLLAAHEGLGRRRVGDHYHDMVEYLRERVAALPWISASGPKRGDVVGRDQKREIVARALPDLLKFDTSITTQLNEPAPELEIEPDSEDENSSSTGQRIHLSGTRKRKREDAALPDLGPPTTKPFLARHITDSRYARLKRISARALVDNSSALADESLSGLHSFMLTCTDEQLESVAARSARGPSRLDIIRAQYASVDDVPDDELFDLGEMEGYMRDDPEEREKVLRICGDDWNHVSECARLGAGGERRPKRRKAVAGEDGWPEERTSRLASDWQLRLDASFGGPLVSAHPPEDEKLEDYDDGGEDDYDDGGDEADFRAALDMDNVYRWKGDDEDGKTYYNVYLAPSTGLEQWLASDW